MKKTVTANIAGTVFHIEEDAYEQLQRYLAGIRSNFSGSAGADEIMADIESRIAELFTDRLTGRNVVSIADVQHVESVMGRPEDFAGENAEGTKGTEASSSTAYAGPRGPRRFMRDPDDKWIGGVLGGLAAYIGMDALWLRIGLIVLVYFSVGSLIPIYILLWILVPKADSAADRLQMRGEPVTVENIKRVVEEGAEKFKAGGERMANEAKDLGKDWGPRATAWGQEAGRSANGAGRTAASIIGKIVGIALIGIAFSLLLSLLTALIGGTVSLWQFTWSDEELGLLDLGALLFNSRAHAAWFGIGVFVLLLVPVIGLFLAGFRLLLNTRTPKWLGWSLAILWFSALIPTNIAGINLGKDFRRSNSIRTEAPLTQPQGNTIYLDLLTPSDSTGNWSVQFNDGDVDVDLDGLHLENGMVSGGWGDCDVERSPDSLYHLMVVRDARARTTKAALDRAEGISYDYEQNGDVLLLSPVLRFSATDKLRAQDVHFVLQVPEGKSVFFRKAAEEVIYDIDNVTNTFDGDMVGKTWTMTSAGLEMGSGKGTTTMPEAADTTRTEQEPKRAPAPAVPAVPKTIVTDNTRGSVELPNVFRLLSRALHI